MSGDCCDKEELEAVGLVLVLRVAVLFVVVVASAQSLWTSHSWLMVGSKEVVGVARREGS